MGVFCGGHGRADGWLTLNVKSLFAWKRPQASVKAAIVSAPTQPPPEREIVRLTRRGFSQGMAVGMVATYLTPTWVFVKVIELAIFVVMFFVIPIVARLPVYDPMAYVDDYKAMILFLSLWLTRRTCKFTAG